MNRKPLLSRSTCWALGILLVAGLSSCGPDPAPASLSRVRAHLAKEPRNLFPLKWASAFESQVGELIFQSLMGLDPLTGALVPQLAKAAPVARLVEAGAEAGQMEYRFTLREGAHFADGRPVTGADVVASYKMAIFPGLAMQQISGAFGSLSDVRVDPADPQSILFYVVNANVLAANYIGQLSIVPAHVYDAQGLLNSVSFGQLKQAENEAALPAALQGFGDEARLAPFGKTQVVGSGPYRLAAWEEGRFLRLVRDSSFWGAKFNEALFWARPDTIEYYPVPDETAALQMLANGDLDVMNNVNAEEAIRLRQDPDRFRLYTPRQYTRTFIYLNMADPILADADTRRGLAHLLNVRFFLDSVQLGFGEALHGPYHPDQPFTAGSTRPVGFSVDSAKQAFARAGWVDADGDGVLERSVAGAKQEFRLEYLYPSASESSKSLALLYADDAAAAGVAITPIGKELGAMIADLGARKFQLVQGAQAGDALAEDPLPSWHTTANTAEGKNRSGFGDAASDAIIDSLLAASDDDLRTTLYQRLAKRILDEQAVIFLIVPQERVIVRQGLTPVISPRRPGYYLPGFSRTDQPGE